MTDDDVVEAMARGMHDVNPGAYRPWSVIVAAEAEGNGLAKRVATLRRNEARAAIRALHERGGLVLGEMPGGIFTGDDVGMGYALALRDISAAAVKVERV